MEPKVEVILNQIPEFSKVFNRVKRDIHLSSAASVDIVSKELRYNDEHPLFKMLTIYSIIGLIIHEFLHLTYCPGSVEAHERLYNRLVKKYHPTLVKAIMNLVADADIHFHALQTDYWKFIHSLICESKGLKCRPRFRNEVNRLLDALIRVCSFGEDVPIFKDKNLNSLLKKLINIVKNRRKTWEERCVLLLNSLKMIDPRIKFHRVPIVIVDPIGGLGSRKKGYGKGIPAIVIQLYRSKKQPDLTPLIGSPIISQLTGSERVKLAETLQIGFTDDEKIKLALEAHKVWKRISDILHGRMGGYNQDRAGDPIDWRRASGFSEILEADIIDLALFLNDIFSEPSRFSGWPRVPQRLGKKGKPALVILRDRSGSMQGLDAWSAATTIGILEVARRNFNLMGYIPFDDHCEPTLIGGRLFTRDIGALMLETLKPWSHGGTNFRLPLRKALEKLGQSPEVQFILLTDGEAQYPEDEVKAAKEREIKINVLYIDETIGGSESCIELQRVPQVLRRIALETHGWMLAVAPDEAGLARIIRVSEIVAHDR